MASPVQTEKGLSLDVELRCWVFHGGVRATLLRHATHDAVGVVSPLMWKR